MVLDNFIEQEIGGRKYKLCLSNMAIFKAERELASGKLMLMLRDLPPSMGDLFTLFKWSLIGGGTVVSEEKAFELYLQLTSEVGSTAVFNIILETLKKAGILSENPKQAAPSA